MDNDELTNAVMKTGPRRAALASLILAKDHDGARQYAEGMTHEDLVEMSLVAAHLESGGTLEAFERELQAQGKTPDEASKLAREMATQQFQGIARMSGFDPDN